MYDNSSLNHSGLPFQDVIKAGKSGNEARQQKIHGNMLASFPDHYLHESTKTCVFTSLVPCLEKPSIFNEQTHKNIHVNVCFNVFSPFNAHPLHHNG